MGALVRTPDDHGRFDYPASLTHRADQLRRTGLPEKLIAAALIPGAHRHFTNQILEQHSLREAARMANRNRDQLRQLMRSIFGDHLKPRSFGRDSFNPRRRFEFRFQLETEAERETHRILGSLGGVDLSAEDKASIVALVRRFGDEREALFAELGARFRPEVAEQVLLSTDQDYSRAYKRSIALAESASERVAIARSLYEIGVQRRDELARWQSADTSDLERSVGQRMAENQAMSDLRAILGEQAVELIHRNGW